MYKYDFSAFNPEFFSYQQRGKSFFLANKQIS